MGWTWYLVTLLPVIGLVQQGLWPAWADRFAYIPLIGFFIMLSWGIPALVPTRKIQMGLLALFCFAALPMLAFSTRQQISYWRDNDGLLRHTIEVTERNHLAHYNLAHILASKGRIEEAILHYSEALKILPENAVFHHDLASVLISKGMVEEAVHHFKEAIRISPDSPEILTNLGSTLRQQGRLEEAFSYLVRAVAIRPIAEAHHNLGLLYTKKEMLNEAIYHYRESLKMRPVDPRIHSDLGIALNFAGEREEALFHLLEAVKLAPENPLLRHNLNMLLQLESESISADGKSDGNPAQGVRP
jgi:Flp pilus assembly protein TadD